MNISFRQVEVFLAVARSLSFSQAARECHLSQPALSASVKKLEELLGAKLFDRHTRKVSLTAVGQEFQTLASLLGESMQHSQVRIREFIEGKRGRLVVAAAPSIASSFAPRTIARFLQQHAQIEVKLVDALSDQCQDMLRAGTADLALTPALPDNDEFHSTQLFVDSLGAIFPSGHPLAGKHRLMWTDLLRYPQVVVHSTGNLRRTIAKEFQRHGAALQPAFEVAQVGTMLGLIQEGLGIGVLSHGLVERFDMRDLEFRSIASPSARRAICFLTAANRAPSPAMAAYLRICQASAGD